MPVFPGKTKCAGGSDLTNGTGAPSRNIAGIIGSIPDDVILRWKETIEKTYNLHPNPEATLEELRTWIVSIQSTIIPAITGEVQSGVVDPWLGGTPEQWAAAEEAITERERKQQEEQHNIDICAKYKLTDFGNSDRFLARYKEVVRYCPPWDAWLILNKEVGVWERDERKVLSEYARNTLISIYGEIEKTGDPTIREKIAKWAILCEKKSHVQEVLSLSSSRQEIVILPDQLDSDPWKLAFQNGIYNLKTHEFCDPDPEGLHSRYIPINYDETRRPVLWQRFLTRIFKSRPDKDEIILFMQKLFGYALTGDTSEQAVFFLYGSGANGKSVLLEVLRAVVGGTRPGYAAVVDPVTFTTEKIGSVRSDIARLAGARVVTTSENPKGSTIDESMIKQITGEKEITAAFKFENEFTFKVISKVFWAFNHRPHIRDVTNSIWRRIRMIPFEEQIPVEEQDPNLAQNLIEQELPGIVNWAIDGLKLYQVEGLTPPKAVQIATNSYREDSDILADFLTMLTITQAGDSQSVLPGLALVKSETVESLKNLYTAYSAYTVQFNEKKMSSRRFSHELEERGFIKKHTEKGKVFHGIRLRENWMDLVNGGNLTE